MTGPEQQPDTSSTNRTITPEKRGEALRQVNRRSPLAFFWEYSKTFIFAVFAFLLIQTFLIQAYKIPSGSMEHTLLVGDFLLVNKLVYGAEVPFTHSRLPRLREPQRGD